MLVEAVALKLPVLYQSLTEAYGAEKGKQMYDELLNNLQKACSAVHG